MKLTFEKLAIFGILIVFLLKGVNAIIGDKKLSNKIDEGVIPYLIFGFKGGGHFEEKIRYSSGSTPIGLYVWKSTEIEDIYNGQMQFEEVFGIFNKGNTLDKLTDDWYDLSAKMQERCYSVVLNDDLSDYSLNINHEEQLIKYDLNDTREYVSSEGFQAQQDLLSSVSGYDREVKFTYEIQEEGFYIFFVSHWQNATSDIGINYVVVNPGNEHLSFDLIPNKITYLVFFLTWICVLLVSGGIVGFKAFRKHNLSYLSILILFSYGLITGYLVLRYAYWIVFSNYGRVNGYFETVVNLLEVSTFMIYLVIINLVASGYRIVCESFSWGRFTKNIVVMSFIVVISLFLRYTNFFLLIFVAVGLIVMVIFLRLDIICWVERLKEINRELNPIFVEERKFIESNTFKMKYYKAFLVYLIIYSIMEVTVLWLRPFLALYHEWIFVLVQQIINLVSMTFLFVTLTFSIQFKKFEGINDGALIAPNPYFKDRSLKVWGEIVAIRSDLEQESFSIHLGIESSQGKRPEIFDRPFISERAKIYTNVGELDNIANSQIPVNLFRNQSPRIRSFEISNWDSESVKENREEQKEFPHRPFTHQFRESEERSRNFSPRSSENLNIFEVENVKDFRNSNTKLWQDEEVKFSPKSPPSHLPHRRANSFSKLGSSFENLELNSSEEEKDSSSISFVSPEMIDFEILL